MPGSLPAGERLRGDQERLRAPERRRGMKDMTLEKIAAACGGTYIGPDEKRQTEISGAVTDSRQVKPGYLFIPIRGERVDGHRFIPQVLEQGAAAVLSEMELKAGAGPYILVKDTPSALKDIAEYYRSTLTIPVVGIAGSVGKTSTKEMVASVLSQKYNVLKTDGNFNNEVGLPLTILRIREEHEAAVVEMGISDFGEMHRLAKIARPDVCIMTNIGLCHLENLKSRDGILAAKSEMFDYLKEDGIIILNGNDDKLSSIKEKNGVVPIRYFVEDGSAPHDDRSYEVTASGIENRGLEGMAAVFHFPEEERRVLIPIPGAHNVYNALAGACAGRALGLSTDEIIRGIETAQTIGGRTNVIEAGGIRLIDDCYNANPVSMKASLEVLAACEGRKIAVLGDMGELGEEELSLHAQVGSCAAESGIDALFCAGTRSEAMARAASAGGLETHYSPDKETMLAELIPYIKKGDAVLVKASHFMEYPKVVSELEKLCAEEGSTD